MEEHINILAVAPYEGLAAVLEREARTYQNVNMTIVVGNLEEGLAAAIDQLVEPFDLILSRGGTADLLRENLDIPVIDIKTSPFDVLQALQLAEGIQGKWAVVGFAGITDAARSTSKVLKLDLDIFTLVDEENVHQVTELLADQGYETILCDVISSNVFREAGFNTVLVTSSSASVRESIDEAVRTTLHLRKAHTENAFLKQVIRNHGGDTVVFQEDGRLTFTTLDRGKSQHLLAMLRELLQEVSSGATSTVRRAIEGQQYTIKSFVYRGNGARTFVVFYITKNGRSTGPRQAGITFYTRSEASEEYLGSPFNLTGEINNVSPTIESVMHANKPLLITGEYGTGRTAVACYAYMNSYRAPHPLVEIDCGMLTDRSQDYLLNARNSPLFSNNQTIHIKNMETTSDTFLTDLFHSLINSDGLYRNGIIFSCDPRGEHVGAHIAYIKDKFQCLEVELHPLRENKERIPTIAKLYLSQLNADLPKEVLRIDRQAMVLLTDYTWPGNYIQFKRVLMQLCVVSRDHTIRATEVRELLALERPSYQHGTVDGTGYGIDLDRPLAQIERDIVEAVIRSNGGNQSAAARQLGISRTTLWRMVKS